MSGLLGRFDTIVRDAEGDVVPSASIEIRRQGATVKAAQSGTTPFTVNVNDVGAIVAGDVVIIETVAGVVGTTSYNVDSVSIPNETITISGFAGTLVLSDEDRFVPTSSLTPLFNDKAGDETLANPITASSVGAGVAYLHGGPVDIVKSGTGLTTRLERDVHISAGDSWIKLWESPWNAKIDGSTDDLVAVTKAISRAYTENGGMLLIPGDNRVMRVSAPIVLLDRVRLAGMSKRGSVIEPTDAFSWNGTTDALVQLGAVAEAGNIFDARVQYLTLMCRGQANSIGIYSDSANEGCGWEQVLVRQAALKGVYLKNTTSRNLMCSGLEVGITTATGIGVHLDAVTEQNTFADITCANSSGAATTARGVFLENASWADFIRLHCEDSDIGVEMSSDSQGIVYGLVGARNVTALIKFNGDGQGVYGLNPTGSAFLILDNSGHTGNSTVIASGATGSYYHIGRGGTGGGRDLHTDYLGTVVTPTTRATQIRRRVNGLIEMNATFLYQRNPITAAATIDATTYANRGNYWTLTGATPVTAITADSSDNGRVLIITAAAAGVSLVDGSNLVLYGDWVSVAAGDTIALIGDGTNWNEFGPRPATTATQTVTLTTAPQTVTVNSNTGYLRLTRADAAVAGDVIVTITYNTAFNGRRLTVYIENNDATGADDVIIQDNATHGLAGDFTVVGGGAGDGVLTLIGDGVLGRWNEVTRATIA